MAFPGLSFRKSSTTQVSTQGLTFNPNISIVSNSPSSSVTPSTTAPVTQPTTITRRDDFSVAPPVFGGNLPSPALITGDPFANTAPPVNGEPVMAGFGGNLPLLLILGGAAAFLVLSK